MNKQDLQKIVSSVKPTFIDRIVERVSPIRGVKRRKARISLAMSEKNSYKGASRSRRATSTWNTVNGDADSDTLFDIPTLRERSRDLVRNNPLAAGALNTKSGNIVGTGLKLNATIDADYLGLSEEEADQWERNTEREFRMWAESKDCDVTRTSNFYGLQELSLRSTLENGDVFTLLSYVERRGSLYTLGLQLIEADRVSNENWKRDTDTLAGGIEKDQHGAPVRYHITKQHPGVKGQRSTEWIKVDAFGAQSGRRNVLHLFRQLRIGQSRGIPDFAPVIEAFKQLGDYTESELTAALVSGLFTVMVHTEGDYDLEEIGKFNEAYGASSDSEIKMGNGSIVNLGVNEKVDIANPGRPNQAFGPFIMAILQQVGVALELPVELLVQQFNSSYSASKAAIEQAWVFFRQRRKWLSDNFCQPVYETWMHEAVALGRIVAPGFLEDPAIRAAYLGAAWIGPAKPVLDLLKEANGRAVMEDRGWVTAAENTTEMTGGDWDRKHRQRAKEHRKRVDDDLEPRITMIEMDSTTEDDDK